MNGHEVAWCQAKPQLWHMGSIGFFPVTDIMTLSDGLRRYLCCCDGKLIGAELPIKAVDDDAISHARTHVHLWNASQMSLQYA